MNMVCELLFLAVLFGAAVSDWSERMIPDHFPVLLLLLGVFAAFTDGWQHLSFVQAVAGALCSAFPLFLSALLVKGAFGGGDIKLMAAAGFCLGVKRGILGLFLGLLAGGIYGLVLTAVRKRKKKEPIPLGPFLAFGLMAASMIPLN